MGFPSLDLFLVDMIADSFLSTKSNLDFVINDTFTDFSSEKKLSVKTYLSRKTFTTDIKSRDDQRVYILPHFAVIDMPLPQISVSLGQEGTAEKVLGDYSGESLPVRNADGEITHWDIRKLYLASASYRIDVVTQTKEETIWLSRLIQRFICESQDLMANIGVFEIDITVEDLKVEQEQLPMLVYNRAIQISCKVENSWITRYPIQVSQIYGNASYSV